MLIVSNTTEDRVHIRFWGKTTQRQSRSAVLLDPAYANSDKELDVLTDLEGGPYLFHETVEKNVAIQVLAYFVENGSLPSDYMWGAYGESLDEFIG
jgi:hypothetical protein